MFNSAVISTAPNFLQADYLGLNNALENSVWNVGDFYPVGYNYIASNAPVSGNGNTTQSGVALDVPAWRHYSPLFMVDTMYFTYIGNLFLDRFPPYKVSEFNDGTQIHNAIIIYGAGTLFNETANPSGGSGFMNNNNADRGKGSNAKHVNPVNAHIVSHTTLSTINSSTSMNNTACWTQSTNWFQCLEVPDGKTKCKFGAKMRVHRNDTLRELNFGGLYCWSENASGSDKKVHYIRIKSDDASYTLPTGSLTGDQAEFNWCGMSSSDQASTSSANMPVYFTNHTTLTATELQTITDSDIPVWTDVEVEFTLESGTSRTLGFAMYFAENCSYMHEGDDDLNNPDNDNVNSGGIHIFNPYVKFED